MFFQRKWVEDPIKLIGHIPKPEVILTITKINTLIQPIGYRSIDDSKKNQIECLKAILLPDENNDPPKEYTDKFNTYLSHYFTFPTNYNMFTRSTCLYALNEVLQSNNFLKERKKQYLFEERIGILKYLLICNQRILDFSEIEQIQQPKINSSDFFEFFAFSMLPNNQYSLNTNMLCKLYKSSFLLKYLMSDDSICSHLQTYFYEKYNVEDIEEFFRIFMFTFLNMYQEHLKIYCLNIPKDNKGVINILNGFCKDTPLKKLNHNDISVMDFLPVKKNPIFTWEPWTNDEFKSFGVLDATFLLEKLDSLFINDFWFDYLKDNTEMNRTDWGNIIGSVFFEPFVVDIISNTFNGVPRYTFKLFDELKIKIPPKREIEICDAYIRKGQKIALIQAKSNFMNMKDGFKSVSSVKNFKELDLDKFYKIFGLPQMVKTLKNFLNFKPYFPDEDLNLNRKIHLYPIILLNEPILASSLFNYPLRERFRNMLLGDGINLQSKEYLIWPLIIISTEELQELEQSIKDGDVEFFKLLDSYHDKTVLTGKSNRNNFKTLLTIYNLINEKVEHNKLFPRRLRNMNWMA